ncbi:protein ROOT INITIATION DEFECTIVE 3-like [Aristolochia californica]|uniref:protein ROOT INITIATION DEFECTIVE 3-like n=1 Tax=Aristolochia californica TaxID=171875 RepID=UPI0035DC5177
MTSISREILLAISPEGPITAYDAFTGNLLAQFSGIRSPPKGITLAGKSVIAASHISAATASGSICLYNWWSSAAFHHIPTPEPVAPLVATSDGSYLFSGGLSGHIHALSIPSGELLRSFPAHHKPVSCLAVNDDSSLLISGGDDGSITVFPILQILDVSSVGDSVRFPLYQLRAHSSSVTAVTTGTGGCNSTVISSSLDCTCKFWSLAHGSHLRTVRFPTVIWCVAVDITESEFYAGGADGRVYIGIMKVGKRQVASSDMGVVAWAPEHGGAVIAVAVANQGLNLVSASADGSIRIWDVETGTVVRVFGQERGSIIDLVVTKGLASKGLGNDRVILRGESSSFSSKELRRPVKEIGEMQEWFNVVVKDRRGAIDTLEVAISTYERLLGLFLNQAKGG